MNKPIEINKKYKSNQIEKNKNVNYTRCHMGEIMKLF